MKTLLDAGADEYNRYIICTFLERVEWIDTKRRVISHSCVELPGPLEKEEEEGENVMFGTVGFRM